MSIHKINSFTYNSPKSIAIQNLIDTNFFNNNHLETQKIIKKHNISLDNYSQYNNEDTLLNIYILHFADEKIPISLDMIKILTTPKNIYHQFHEEMATAFEMYIYGNIKNLNIEIIKLLLPQNETDEKLFLLSFNIFSLTLTPKLTPEHLKYIISRIELIETEPIYNPEYFKKLPLDIITFIEQEKIKQKLNKNK